MVFTLTDFDKAKAKGKKNCSKGLACGAGCISKTKKCKQKMGAGGGAYADHVSDPDNLEKGAESSEGAQQDDPLLDELANLGLEKPPSEYKEWRQESEKAEEDKTLAERLNPNAPPPTEDQAEAINTYTGSMYSDINQLLRNPKGFKEDYDNDLKYEKEVQAITDKITEGLSSLPDYKGETYRGGFVPNEIIQQMKVGGTYSDKGFLSTSQDKDMGQSFVKTYQKSDHSNVFFTIDGKHGKDISKAADWREEKEVLFSPSSKFKITSMEEKDGVLQVRMKQYGKQK